MSKFDHDAFMEEWRSSRLSDGSRIAQSEYSLIMSAINGTWSPRPKPTGKMLLDPTWLKVARTFIGQKEIVGPRHNNWIAQGWAKLGASWFNDDETPWCGFFVAHCMDAVKLSYPGKGLFARAKAWLDWGKPSQPVLGAIVVFGRDGGGHVGFLVGESDTAYYVLGGNQSNAVNIMPFDKVKRKPLGFRWPAGLPAGTTALPRMTGGTVSVNEQ